MVNPSWEDFEYADEQNESEEIPHIEQEQKQEIQGGLQDAEMPEAEKPQWGDFLSPETYQGEEDPTAEESTLGYIVRNITANASRLGEQFFGRRGNLEKMGKDILSNMPELGGLLGYGLSELMGPAAWEKMVKGPPGRQQTFPTSENLKELSQELTGGYTKPKTPGEEKFQGYTEDVGSTIGGARNISARNIAVNNLGIPIAANAVKETIEGLGFGTDKATYTKLGVWTALSLLGNVNAPQFASQLMNQGRNGIPNQLPFNVPRLQQRMQAVSRAPYMLHADPRTNLAREELANINRDLANGQTTVRSLMTTYDGVNAAKRNRGLFEFNRDDQNFARAAIDRVRNAVRDEIMDAGGQYPQALNSWRSGIQAWAVIHQSRGITNWIDGLARGPYAKLLSGPAAALFGVGSFGAYKSPLIAGPLSVATPLVYKTGQTAYRVWQDPNLSRYYWASIAAAQRENAPAFISNYNKLNKALEKSDTTKKKAKSKK
jgi:hypothetical protein